MLFSLSAFSSGNEDPNVIEIAQNLGKDPAQVLISWAVQRGTVVLPKSVTPARIKSNFQGKRTPLLFPLTIWNLPIKSVIYYTPQ